MSSRSASAGWVRNGRHWPKTLTCQTARSPRRTAFASRQRYRWRRRSTTPTTTAPRCSRSSVRVGSRFPSWVSGNTIGRWPRGRSYLAPRPDLTGCRCNDAACKVQESEATPTAFGDVKVVTHDPHAERIVELSVDSRPAIATESGGARPGHRADVSTSIDPPDPLGVRVGDVDIAGDGQ